MLIISGTHDPCWLGCTPKIHYFKVAPEKTFRVPKSDVARHMLAAAE